MGNISKQSAGSMVLAAATWLINGGALAGALSFPSTPAVAGNGYAAGMAIDTPPEFSLFLYGIVILAVACHVWLLWLVLRSRAEGKARDTMNTRTSGQELRPLDEAGAAQHPLTRLAGRIGQPGAM